VLDFSMRRLFETVSDLDAQAETIRTRRYGVIELCEGRVVAVHLRPWPKLVSLVGLLWGQAYHKYIGGDRMWVYYNQPARWPNFLAVKFVVSSRNTSWATARRALAVLDDIAQIKRSDALLCDAANFRLSPRLLAREGWERHTSSRWHRNYIKRFYGSYPRLWMPAAEETFAKTA
jgi:hypothetical protein